MLLSGPPSAILSPSFAVFFLCISVSCRLPGLLAVLGVDLNASALEQDTADHLHLFDVGAVLNQQTRAHRGTSSFVGTRLMNEGA